MAIYKPGDIIRFTYHHLRVDEDTGPPYKEVFVLNPLWRGEMHGIDLKRLTDAERQVLEAIMDPQWKTKRHPLPLVNDIWHRLNPPEDIKNPMSFYVRFVKVFLRGKDAYRRYKRNRMLNPSIVKKSPVQGTTFNPKPLFHKVETKPQETTPTTPTKPGRLASLAAAAKSMFGKLFGRKK